MNRKPRNTENWLMLCKCSPLVSQHPLTCRLHCNNHIYFLWIIPNEQLEPKLKLSYYFNLSNQLHYISYNFLSLLTLYYLCGPRLLLQAYFKMLLTHLSFGEVMAIFSEDLWTKVLWKKTLKWLNMWLKKYTQRAESPWAVERIKRNQINK